MSHPILNASDGSVQKYSVQSLNDSNPFSIWSLLRDRKSSLIDFEDCKANSKEKHLERIVVRRH